jgi:hypothetical protein
MGAAAIIISKGQALALARAQPLLLVSLQLELQPSYN